MAGTDLVMSREEFYDLVKMPQIRELERRYLTDDELTARYGREG